MQPATKQLTLRPCYVQLAANCLQICILLLAQMMVMTQCCMFLGQVKTPLLCVTSVTKESSAQFINSAHVSPNSQGTSERGGVNTADVSANTEGVHTIDVSDAVHGC